MSGFPLFWLGFSLGACGMLLVTVFVMAVFKEEKINEDA
mgnify:CR=1 FL=1